MSVKDTRYYRRCPICDDTLIGTDDGLEVFESIRGQLRAVPDEIPNCTLCGENCRSLEQAHKIVEFGPPQLFDTITKALVEE